MPTSIPGMKPRRSPGFTLIELSVVLFVLGLILWLAAPRLASVGQPDRGAVFRDIAAGSEAAFDLSLFEKKETRLVLDPSEGTYLFHVPTAKDATGEGMEKAADAPPAKPLGGSLSITGISIEGQERPLDIVTEIRYLPGGRVPDARIFFRDGGAEGKPTDWTLKLNPADGSVDVLEGTVLKDA